ncbi:UNVERIFIED_CONTAM: hypothetical protein ABID98_002831 [Brevibacillus sp. OAP136]
MLFWFKEDAAAAVVLAVVPALAAAPAPAVVLVAVLAVVPAVVLAAVPAVASSFASLSVKERFRKEMVVLRESEAASA